jgi:hypothetical protein
MSDLFPDLTPTVVQVALSETHYSRRERRKHAFVLKNLVNDKFVKREIVGNKITYSDVELKNATGFKWISLSAVMTEMLHLKPTLDITPVMAYRDPKTRKICVK